MAYIRTDDSHYKAIAGAIRALHEGEEGYTPAEMAEYLSTEGTSLKPWNIAKGISIFGVTGTLEPNSGKWPGPAPEDEIDTAVKKTDVRADTTDKFVLMQDDGNITVGYPLKDVYTGMAFYNGVKLPDIGNGATYYIFRRDSDGAYIYLKFNKGCEAYSYIMWSVPQQEYQMVRREAEAIYYSIYVLKDGVWKYEDGNGTGSGISLGRACKGELIWAGSDVYNADDTVLHHASYYTYAPEDDVSFTITAYDPVTTEFKARCWLRAAYHTTGSLAGQITVDSFVDTESGGWNFIKNMRYCTRDALYYGEQVIWQKE